MKSGLHFFVEKIYNWVLKLIGYNDVIVADPEKKIRNMINLCLEKEKIRTDELDLIFIK